MSSYQRIEKILIWILIAALANPFAYAQVPPNGVGDFTLYTSTPAAGAYEPNILLLIDTSDSMNLPEGWKEYPGAYDSHVEYLWNDINAISTTEVTTETDGKISTGNGYLFTPLGVIYDNGDYSAVWGPWSNKVMIQLADTSGYHAGGTITLAGNALAALNGTFAITSVEDSSDGRHYVLINPPPGGGFTLSGGNWFNNTPGTQYNAWSGSGVVPIGTVMPAPRKPLGFWGGSTPAARTQIWQAAANYAQNTQAGDPGARSIYRNYQGSSLYWLPAGTAETDRRLWSNAFNHFLGADIMSRFGSVNGNTDPILRGNISFGNLPNMYSGYNQCQASKEKLTPSTVFAPSSIPWNDGKVLGQKWQRYERYLNLDSSLAAGYPGSDGKTINGNYYDGYLNANRDVNDWAVSGNLPMPIRVRKPGNSSYAGWSDLKPDWGGYHFKDRLWEIPDFTSFNQLLGLYGVNTAGIATLNDARIVGYKNLAVPGYYDNSSNVNVNGTTLTKTRSCNWTGKISETDAGNLPRRNPVTLSYGGTCSDNGITCSDPANPTCGGASAPDACAQPVLENFYSRDNNNCQWSGRSQLVTKNFSGCHWAGARLHVPGEGVGDFYYGGSCIGSCTGPDCPVPVDWGSNYCVNSTTPSQQFGGVTYNNVNATTNPAAGCDNRTDNGTVYYYGGTCAGDYRLAPGTAGVWPFQNDASACDKNVTASVTVNGVTMTDVRTDSSTAGCSDKIDPYQSCDARHGGGCNYQTCDIRLSSTYVGGNNYTVYDRSSDVDWVMVHDCIADEGAGGPYMTQLQRDFGAPWGIGAGNSAPNKTLSYDTDAAKAIATAPAYDVYSVNYLNWKFGAKSNGNPIGRKTRLQTAKDAMVKLVLAQNGVRFGLMVFNRMDQGANSEGGNIVFAVQRMGTNKAGDIAIMSAAELTANTAALNNRQALINKINSLTAVSQTPLTESLYESYRYFRGEAPLFGRLATAAKAGGAVSASCDKNAFATPGAASDCLGSSGNYVSPMMMSLDPAGQPAACSKNFVIMTTDGGPEGDYSANAAIKALSYTDPASGTTVSPTQSSTSGQFENAATGKPYGPVGADAASATFDGGYVWLDELAYYMANADMNENITGRQPVNTYTIGFAGADSPVLANTATQGNGQYYVAADAAALSTALTAAVAAIVEWNPSLAAPTVPISALNRSESANDVYLSFFGPSSSQAWSGTVKKFRLGQGSSDCGNNADGSDIPLCLIGKSVLSGATVKNIEQLKIDPANGTQTAIINPAAVSFWNPSGTQDGALPNKGGTGQALLDNLTPATRKVYTYISGVSTTAALTDSKNAVKYPIPLLPTWITKERLGNAAMTALQQLNLINYIRGGNPWRSWPHADVMHAKPAIVTYDPTPVNNADSGVQVPTAQYLFYLSNDGLLHAVNAANGQEAWSFLVEEALPQIQAMYDNQAGQHLMLADGTLTAWVYDKNGDGKIVSGDDDKAYLYFGLRRGGRAYYALDITDITQPKFMWKIDRQPAGAQLCNTACAAAADYDELGYTWSAPVAGRIRALATAGVPAIIFGGGYDANQDNFPASAADSMGRAVYVVNGLDGSLIKAFKNISGMDFSIPANVSALNTDMDSQGLLDRLYVGDTAANLWRFDIDNANPANWTAKKLAALSDTFSLPATQPNRKILTPPVVVKQRYQGQDYDAVYVGSGDREHPLLTTSADRVFMIKDFDTGLAASNGSPIDVANLYDITQVLQESEMNPGTFNTAPGWSLSLGSGEKVFSQPTVYYNILRFSTFNPTASLSACLPPGKGMLYAIDARYGGTVPGTITTGSSSYLQMRQSNAFVSATGGKAGGLAGGLGVAPSGGGVNGPVTDGTLVVSGKNVYVMHCSPGCVPEKIGTVGGATKMYWYRETAR